MKSNKKTLVLGASPNPDRYSFKAVMSLINNGHDVVAVGIRHGMIGGIEIRDESVFPADVHTVTIYMNAVKQELWIKSILGCKPQRIIFNPGAENEVLKKSAQAQEIETMDACTLVMLATGTY